MFDVRRKCLNHNVKPEAREGGRGDSHMKLTGMLIVALRGVNFGFWSRLGCSGHSTNNYIKLPRNTGLREEKQK